MTYDPHGPLSERDCTFIGQALNNKLHDGVRSYCIMEEWVENNVLSEPLTEEEKASVLKNSREILDAIDDLRRRFVPVPMFTIDELISHYRKHDDG
jgi:hypothetical protein